MGITFCWCGDFPFWKESQPSHDEEYEDWPEDANTDEDEEDLPGLMPLVSSSADPIIESLYLILFVCEKMKIENI